MLQTTFAKHATQKNKEHQCKFYILNYSLRFKLYVVLAFLGK